ncbi:hypothetical protein TBLA_0I02730 [Henningerozyma blattae CBS 6284]|uniref:Iron-sulfur cluster biogenesis chaperone, mitochondrial n=1 Tax=Henningerozyma blattae (strain ATCC 34711 / CBS 6284 / DSM 70876 / NBRC 10599 / NRRL Y-10934 / UCD 77-7) TaxID=1071380 RepID=I2H977_HENB6|nr:hypothetical protein TBLA_0I02730 [Tetrapisispora blattae CBS 6284]CCH62929.1 hypothetical protein TBLA_0I02730 [Tetrapisispora blattae CBS 6284]
MLKNTRRILNLPKVTPPLTRSLYSTTCCLNSSKVIGIDLGTTNSAVAYIANNSPQIISNHLGKRTTPSIVAFDKDSNVLIGEIAKRQALVNPDYTFFATKRLIGKSFQSKEIQKDIKNLPYTILPSNTGGIELAINDGSCKSPNEIASHILKYLKSTASDYLNEDISKAVITVPAYFNDSQRQATKDAGNLAGLQVIRVLNEPTAAALSFGFHEISKKKNSGLIAVYDLGGGTFDISILDIENGVFEVKATNGDTHLGGEDFDNIIVNYLLDEFIKLNPTFTKPQLLQNRELIQRIKDASERAKIELSHISETQVELPFIIDNKHLKISLTESQLDEMTLHLINKTLISVEKAMQDADIEYQDIDDILLVGGMTRMPKIRSILSKTFNKKVNTSINPDETVALGAAIQGGILSGEIKNVLLLDVTPLTLGIETYGGAFSPLIPRNTTVPVKKTEVFSTGIDGQTSVDIRVFQGERGLVRDNKLIGDFKLTGVEPMAKGKPQIFVTFDIDADGILNVSASEKSSGTKKSVTVVANSGLSKDEIDQIIDDANKNKKMDNMLRERVELLTKADVMISDSESAFKAFKDKISNEKDYLIVLNELNQIREVIDYFKKNESDLSLDINILKKDVDSFQNKAFKLFQQASKNKKEITNETK